MVEVLKIFGTSIPKSGTHLLEKIFSTMGYETFSCPKTYQTATLPDVDTAQFDKIYAYGHWPFAEVYQSQIDKQGYKLIVLIRDPRDICLSMADFLKSGSPKQLHKENSSIRDRPWKDLVKITITGSKEVDLPMRSISSKMENYLTWESVGGIVVKYEDLIAKGTSQTLTDFVARIEVDPVEFEDARGTAVGHRESKTLNKGVGARWRSEFDDELIALWKENAGGLAASMGYDESF